MARAERCHEFPEPCADERSTPRWPAARVPREIVARPHPARPAARALHDRAVQRARRAARVALELLHWENVGDVEQRRNAAGIGMAGLNRTAADGNVDAADPGGAMLVVRQRVASLPPTGAVGESVLSRGLGSRTERRRGARRD
jgi:hypothetical protein